MEKIYKKRIQIPSSQNKISKNKIWKLGFFQGGVKHSISIQQFYNNHYESPNIPGDNK